MGHAAGVRGAYPVGMLPTRGVVLAVALAVLAACASDAAGSAADDGAGAARASVRARSAPLPAPSEGQPAIEPSEGFATADIALTDGARRVPMSVWVADTGPLRRRGLMDRRALPDDSGMLFMFDTDTRGGFWMKNTLIPLSIAFIDDRGHVVEILDMTPCETPVCPVYRPERRYRYALEAEQGFFDDHGVTTGWTVDLDDVQEPS